MSHVVCIETEIRDAQALRAACVRLHLKPPVQETVRLFSAEAHGYSVRLPDWRYPVVCDLDRGQVLFDNYQGRWGAETELEHLKQAYAVEKACLAARQRGHTVRECSLADGSIQLTIEVGGTA